MVKSYGKQSMLHALRRVSSVILFFISCFSTFAQQNEPLNRESKLLGPGNYKLSHKDSAALVEQILNKIPAITGPSFASCFKPYIVPVTYQKKDKSRNWFVRKLKKESLFIVNDTAEHFNLTIDPLMNLEFGLDLEDKTHERLYKNTRGFLVRGSIGKKFAFESSFYENQATYARYIDSYIAGTDDLFPQTANYEYAVVPGQGRSKKFRTNGYDYAMASGYISYSPNRILNVQVGHGKHFVGDGYRSLLLSDNAFNYPFARITTTYKIFQYTNLYTSFMNLTNGGVTTPPHVERLFQKKTGSFQMLSVNLWNRLQLGLFQGMIWEAADTMNRQHVNFNTFDPVIGVNTAVYGLHNDNNILWGATLKLKIVNTLSLYGQFMLDDVRSGSTGDAGMKNGYQIGLKYFDMFTVKNLHLQLEYNTVRPYAYAAENSYQSYTHYNQSLAHPLGANFWEAVGFLNYSIKDFFIELKANYAVKGQDTAAFNYGGNVFKPFEFSANQPPDNISTTQGLKTTIITKDIHIGYMLNRSTNLNVVAGVSLRTEQTVKGTSETKFYYVGIRTSLANFYYDF